MTDMNWDSLDKDIKNGLSAHRPEVDADAIWAAIEPEVDALNRRKKRRRGLWLWWAGVLVAIAAIGYYLYAQPNGLAANTEQDIAKAEYNDRPNSVDGLSAVNTANNGTGTGFDNPKKSSPREVDNGLGNTMASSQLSAKNRKATEPKKLEYFDNKLKANIPQLIDAETSKQLPLPYETGEEHEQSAGLVQLEVKPVEALPNMSLGFFETNIAPPSLPAAVTLPVVKAPPPLRRQFNFSTSLQGSISFVGRNLEAKDSTGIELLNLREKTERVLESYQVGLGFTLGHRTGFGLSSGLNYTQINERFEYKTTVLAVDTINDVKYLVVNLNNDTIPIYGDVPLTTKTTFYKKYYNKLRMVDIPILAGYDIKLRNTAIGLQAGVFVNIRLETAGQILKSATETIELQDASFIKKNIGLSYYFGASAGYMFNDNIEAYIAPFVRHFPKSIATGSYELQQRYNLFGINMGARYRF